MHNSTLTRRTPLRPKKVGIPSKPLRQSGAMKKEKGLGRQVEIVMGFYRPPGHKMPTLLRSEQHRRNVAGLACACCGKAAPSQCAHANFNKGAAMKVCDSLTFPLCPACHRQHDQGGMSRETRRLAEWEYVDGTRAQLMMLGQWSPEVELHYQKAVEPLRRLVKGED